MSDDITHTSVEHFPLGTKFEILVENFNDEKFFTVTYYGDQSYTKYFDGEGKGDTIEEAVRQALLDGGWEFTDER